MERQAGYNACIRFGLVLCLEWVVRGSTTIRYTVLPVLRKVIIKISYVDDYCPGHYTVYRYVKAILTTTSWCRSSQLSLIAMLLRRICEMAETQGSYCASQRGFLERSMKPDLKCRIFLNLWVPRATDACRVKLSFQ